MQMPVATIASRDGRTGHGGWFPFRRWPGRHTGQVRRGRCCLAASCCDVGPGSAAMQVPTTLVSSLRACLTWLIPAPSNFSCLCTSCLSCLLFPVPARHAYSVHCSSFLHYYVHPREHLQLSNYEIAPCPHLPFDCRSPSIALSLSVACSISINVSKSAPASTCV